jgi:HD superfamily phosphohydrolase YqeK
MKKSAPALSRSGGESERMAGRIGFKIQRRLNRFEERVFRLAKPYLKARDNEVHTRAAIEFALRLLETEKADRDVVLTAIILHDVGYSAVPEEMILRAYGPRKEKVVTRIHEQEGAGIAAAILNEVGYDASKTTEILEIIDGHDTRPVALSINDQVVKDADKLTRYARDLRSWPPSFCLTAQEAAARLERFVENWFFLATSKDMAKEELKQRRIEADQP